MYITDALDLREGLAGAEWDLEQLRQEEAQQEALQALQLKCGGRAG
jgi:hypothetical protein